MKIQLKILNKEYYANMSKLNLYNSDLPTYATSGSAAIDLVCTEDITIYPGETKMIHTGIAIWIGSHIQNKNKWGMSIDQSINVAGFILPRSGLGGDKGLILANTIGLIDEDYQGELLVKAWNRNLLYYDIEDDTNAYVDEEVVELKAGDRFCQLVFMPVIKAQWEVVEEFSSSTQRGEGGFNSTGVK